MTGLQKVKKMQGGRRLDKNQESIPLEFKVTPLRSHFLSWDSNVSQKLSVVKGSTISKVKENIFQKQHVKTRFPAPRTVTIKEENTHCPPPANTIHNFVYQAHKHTYSKQAMERRNYNEITNECSSKMNWYSKEKSLHHSKVNQTQQYKTTWTYLRKVTYQDTTYYTILKAKKMRPAMNINWRKKKY